MSLDEEKKLCEEATPGEWPYYYDKDVLSQIGIDGIAHPAIPPSDAKFIAHFNPDKVMKMLRVIEMGRIYLKHSIQFKKDLGGEELPNYYSAFEKALKEAGYDS